MGVDAYFVHATVDFNWLALSMDQGGWLVGSLVGGGHFDTSI